MELSENTVAGPAIHDGFGFLFSEMACTAAQRHHRRFGVNLVAGDAVKRGSIPCPVAEVAEYLGVLALEGPGVPRFVANRCYSSERQQWTTLGDRVTDRTRINKDFASVIDMGVVVASKAPGPVPVTDVIRISGPVHFHPRKNISIVDCEDGVNRLLNQGLLTFKDFRMAFAVKSFNQDTDTLTDVLAIAVVFD